MTDVNQADIVDAYPLTHLQQGMLFHILSNPDTPQYIGTITAMLEGPLTQEAAERAWQTLLNRHEALRTAFLWDGLDHPMQVVHAELPLELHWNPSNENLTRTPAFDLARAPLMRVSISAETDTRFCLTWQVHHMIADGWSAAVILQEFLFLLDGKILTPAPAFAAHAEWLDGQDHASDAAFWADYFKNYQHNPLPVGGQGSGLGRKTLTLSPEVLAHLTRTAQNESVTVGTVWQLAFAQALGQLTDSRDVIFGLASSGRSSPIEDAEHCVGVFVNTLPMRVRLNDGQKLLEVERTSLALRDREHVPQALLARYSNTPAGQNMVDAVLSLRTTPAIEAKGGFSISGLTTHTPSNFPLNVEVDPVTGCITATYARACLEHAQVETFLSNIAGALTDQPQGNVHPAVPLTTPVTDVLDRFLAIARDHPDAYALIDGSTTMTFEALATKAHRLAGGLVSQGISPGDRVALVLPRTVDFVVAIIGSLIVGAAYVPIDDTYPVERISSILAACEPKLVLRDNDMASLCKADPLERVEVALDAPAYLIYTSGSTGTPKGVEISRGALATSQAARDQFYTQSPDSFLLLSPFAFDSSVVGIYWALTSGATLVIAAKGAEQDMAALGTLIRKTGVTHTLMLPTLYEAMLGGADNTDLSGLRQVIVAGETCPHKLPALHAEILPRCAIANEYGPTEATVWAIADNNSPGDGSPLTIGLPIAGMQVLLLDEAREVVPAGQTGEIALAGPGLATGYFNHPEDTDAAFVTRSMPDGSPMRFYLTGDRARQDADGRFVYLGRNDRQVKIRGHRIELGDIEAAIATLPGVRDVGLRAVPARPASSADLQSALSHLSEAEVKTLLIKAGGFP